MRVSSRRVVIITGMHRSGTSMVAAMVEASGVDLGSGFPTPDDRNPHGYFEDEAMLTWQSRLLEAAVPAEPVGHPDWGWVESESLDQDLIDGHRSEARELLRARAARHGRELWGWKDPRTTILLDLWAGLLPRARYVLVFRDPAGVAGSIVRMGPGDLSETPDRPYQIWDFYNRRIRDFARQHRRGCLVVEAESAAGAPDRFASLVARFLDRPQADLAPLVDPSLLRAGDPAAVPESSRQLFEELVELADLP